MVDIIFKKCNKCEINLPIDKFHKLTKSKDGHSNECSDCRKQYHIDNKEKINNYHKEHYKKSKYQIEYKKKLDKSVVNKKAREIYHSNIQTKLKFNISNRVRAALNKSFNRKNNPTLDLLGCNIDFLKQYLEQQFLPEMTWKNHGIIWEIDHKTPCSKFDLTSLEQQKICFNYTNLKPIFKTTEIAESLGHSNHIGNRNKSDKIF